MEIYYSLQGDQLEKAYDLNGNVIWLNRLDGYTNRDESIRYAYEQMIDAKTENAEPFFIFTDQHDYFKPTDKTFENMAEYVDFSRIMSFDLGDDVNGISYASVQAKKILCLTILMPQLILCRKIGSSN